MTIRNERVQFRIERDKKIELDFLLNKVLEENKLSKYGNKADISADAMIIGLKSFINREVRSTNTKKQESEKSKKESIIKELIKELDLMSIKDIFNIFYINNKFGNDIRTKNKWLCIFLSNEDIRILYFPKYNNLETPEKILIIKKNSRYGKIFPELSLKLFNLNYNINNKDKFIEYIINQIKFNINIKELDIAQIYYLLLIFWKYKFIKIKPKTKGDLSKLKEIIELKFRERYIEADKLIIDYMEKIKIAVK